MGIEEVREQIVRVEEENRKSHEALKQLSGEAGNVIEFLRSLLKVQEGPNNDEKVLIALETGWVPDMERAQIQPLLSMISRIAGTEGFENIVTVYGKGDDFTKDIIRKCEKESIPLERVIVLGDKETIGSDSFERLRSTETETRAFLIGIDPQNIQRRYDGKSNIIMIFEMLKIALKLAMDETCGIDSPFITIVKGAIDGKIIRRFFIFIPAAEPYDYDELGKEYELQIRTLEKYL